MGCQILQQRKCRLAHNQFLNATGLPDLPAEMRAEFDPTWLVMESKLFLLVPWSLWKDVSACPLSSAPILLTLTSSNKQGSFCLLVVYFNDLREFF
jgi:hypothetical protein